MAPLPSCAGPARWKRGGVGVPWILSLLLAVSAAGCGGSNGGEGGNGDGGDPAPLLPLTSRVGVGQSAGQTLQFAFAFGADSATLTVSELSLGGELNKSTHSVSITSAGMRLDSGRLLGQQTVVVQRPLAWSSTGMPTSGQLLVTRSDGAIRITLQSGAPNVTLQYTPAGGAAQTSTWSRADFGEVDVFDTRDPVYVRASALTCHTMALLRDRLVETAHHLMQIAAQEREIQRAGAGKSLALQGDYLPPASRRGSVRITWTDVSEPFKEVGPGDSFLCAHTDYWVDDPAEDQEPAYVSGEIRLTNYIENRSPVVLGFGEVQYLDAAVRTVEEYPAGSFRYVGGPVVVRGGLSVTFTAE